MRYDFLESLLKIGLNNKGDMKRSSVKKAFDQIIERDRLL